jgi:hypothetical protein
MEINHYTSLLKQFNNFQECLLLDFWSENLCRDLVILVDNIWERPGKMRPNLDEHEPVHIYLKQYRRILIENIFSDYILQHPKEVNWGINEFSLIQLFELSDGWLKLVVLWENARKIEVECQSIDIKKSFLRLPD